MPSSSLKSSARGITQWIRRWYLQSMRMMRINSRNNTGLNISHDLQWWPSFHILERRCINAIMNVCVPLSKSYVSKGWWESNSQKFSIETGLPETRQLSCIHIKHVLMIFRHVLTLVQADVSSSCLVENCRCRDLQSWSIPSFWSSIICWSYCFGWYILSLPEESSIR